MASLRARVVAVVAPLDRGSRYVRDVDALRAHVAPGARAASADPPAWLRRRVRVARGEIAGVRCYRLSPRAGAVGGGGHVLYLHGGAYVGEVSVHHWRFLARLVRASEATMIVPIYPLAPRAVAGEVVAAVAGVQRALGAPLLMGDSAGAGLALAVAQALRDEPRPSLAPALVLLSPWVDVTMTNPGIPAVAPRDPLLGVQALTAAGRLYAGTADAARPPVSPINGDLAGLGAMTILIGTRDVLLPDARRLRTLAEAAGGAVTYIEEPDMLHDWMLLPIPEASRTIEQLAPRVAAALSPARR